MWCCVVTNDMKEIRICVPFGAVYVRSSAFTNDCRDEYLCFCPLWDLRVTVLITIQYHIGYDCKYLFDVIFVFIFMMCRYCRTYLESLYSDSLCRSEFSSIFGPYYGEVFQVSVRFTLLHNEFRCTSIHPHFVLLLFVTSLTTNGDHRLPTPPLPHSISS